MRKLLRTVVVMGAVLTVSTALAAEPTSNVGGIRSDEKNEMAIRALYK
jgi:hypothetical protein